MADQYDDDPKTQTEEVESVAELIARGEAQMQHLRDKVAQAIKTERRLGRKPRRINAGSLGKRQKSRRPKARH